MPEAREPDARAFYRDLLGLPARPKPPHLAGRGGCWFALSDGQQLHVGVEEDFRPARKAHPGVHVDDLDAYAASCTGAGLDIEWDDRYPGVRRFYVHDPFGNRIELLSG